MSGSGVLTAALLLEQSLAFWGVIATLFGGIVSATGIGVRHLHREAKRNSLRNSLRSELKSMHPHIYDLTPLQSTPEAIRKNFPTHRYDSSSLNLDLLTEKEQNAIEEYYREVKGIKQAQQFHIERGGEGWPNVEINNRELHSQLIKALHSVEKELEVEKTALLTREQHQFLQTAVEEGYFDVPRGIVLSELSDLHGLSAQEASTRSRNSLEIILWNETYRNTKTHQKTPQ